MTKIFTLQDYQKLYTKYHTKYKTLVVRDFDEYESSGADDYSRESGIWSDDLDHKNVSWFGLKKFIKSKIRVMTKKGSILWDAY